MMLRLVLALHLEITPGGLGAPYWVPGTESSWLHARGHLTRCAFSSPNVLVSIKIFSSGLCKIHRMRKGYSELASKVVEGLVVTIPEDVK